MLPLSPLTKILIEQIELGIVLVYLLAGIPKPKRLSYGLLLGVAVCLAVDIYYYHTNRSAQVWGVLNTPGFLLSIYLVYVKIIRKSAKVVGKKLGYLILLLFR